MADDNRLRSHRNSNSLDARYTDAHDPAPASDPLAELARLIGQTDPFADIQRGPGAPPRHAEHVPPREPAAGDWRQHIEIPRYQAMRGEPAAPGDQHYSSDPADEYRYDRDASHHQDYAAAGNHPDDGMYQERYRDEHPREHQHYAQDEIAQGHRTHVLHASNLAPQAAEYAYDDPPGREHSGRRRGYLATAALLALCALIGTVGAYGYRNFISAPSGAAPAPVIVADKSPSKVVPAATEQKSSRSQERLPSPGGSERLVPREEQPITLRQPGNLASAQSIAPAPVSPAQAAPPPAPPVAAAPQAAPPVPPTTAANEPKRIRTVTIRPDGDPSGGPVAETRAAPSRPTPNAGITTNSTSPRVPTRGEPLSLDPTAQAEAPQARAPVPPAPRANSGRAAPERWDPAPRESSSTNPRLASAPSNGDSGGYVVQVSSQRSESDARASFRGLQAKYSQLKSRQPIIRRADLGSKGTYYRAMVGPFDSASEAGEFCSGLKKAGGQCIILRN